MRLILAILAIVTVLGGYTGYWYWLSDRLLDGVIGWAAAQRDKGHDIAFDRIERSGFPYRIRIDVVNPQAVVSRGKESGEWRAERVWAIVQPWKLNHVIGSVEGRQDIAWSDGGKQHTAMLASETNRFSLVLDGAGQPLRFALDMTAPSWRPSDGPPLDAARARLFVRANHGDEAGLPAGSYNVALSAETLKLPDVGKPLPFGPVVQEVAVESLVTGPLRADRSWRKSLLAWRDGGGRIEVGRFAAIWGDLDLQAEGTLTLDDERRPAGTLTTRIAGFNEAVDALVQTGTVRNKDANLIKIALALLAKPTVDGRPTLTAPLSATDGRVYLGPAKLLKVRPLF
ncbi:DUF2125 domain-containing protein [Oceanibacterium hippocampi]|uniref:DUF2125 domain-containing protein n=1 Tax=Oceanibacterium hippocampi TaxID=745714 RepID=A0A1Y5RVR1_9PROT|nr:DUF2125 domain-containing protein [Oceanibacterium hippocampi]SLN26377.1 hypothetical protein OCH7691_00811 [Oceanibacterium hippocampi]